MRYPLWCFNPKYLLKTLEIIMFPQAVMETSNKPLKVWDDKTFCLNHNQPRTNYKIFTTWTIIVWIYCYTTEELNFTLTKISIVCIKQMGQIIITRTQYFHIKIFVLIQIIVSFLLDELTQNCANTRRKHMFLRSNKRSSLFNQPIITFSSHFVRFPSSL